MSTTIKKTKWQQVTVFELDKAKEHLGHTIVIVSYGTPIVNYALECETCSQVLADWDHTL